MRQPEFPPQAGPSRESCGQGLARQCWKLTTLLCGLGSVPNVERFLLLQPGSMWVTLTLQTWWEFIFVISLLLGHPHSEDPAGRASLGCGSLPYVTVVDHPGRCCTTGAVCQGVPTLSLSLCLHTKDLESHSYPLDGTTECILSHCHACALRSAYCLVVAAMYRVFVRISFPANSLEHL